MLKNTYLAMLLTIMFLGACGNNDVGKEKKLTGLDARGILNGTIDTTNKYKGVVPLLLSVDNRTVSSTCSGSVIDSKLVLTAAHCAKGYPYVYVLNSIGNWVLSDAREIHTQYNGKGTPDLAVLRFPEALGFSALPMSSSLPAVGSLNTIVGYGDYGSTFVGGVFQANKNNIWDNGTFVRRYGTIKIKSILSSSQPIYPKAIISVQKYTNQLACQGDSGGPLLVAGKIIGVASSVRFGTVIETSAGKKGVCSTAAEGFYVSTLAFASFISGAKSKLLAPPPPPPCNPFHLTNLGTMWKSQTTGTYYSSPSPNMMTYDEGVKYCQTLSQTAPISPWYLTDITAGVIEVDSSGMGRLVHAAQWKSNDGVLRHVICGSGNAGVWQCPD